MIQILYNALIILGVVALVVIGWGVVELVERRQKNRSTVQSDRAPPADPTDTTQAGS